MQKAIKIFTLVSYLAIVIPGEHVGGPLVMFLALFIVNWGVFIWSLVAMGIVAVIATLAWTIFNPSHRLVKIIVPAGLVILYIPFLRNFLDVLNHTMFAFTLGLFLISSATWIAITFLEEKE